MSGTSIGANVREAETEHWLELLYETEFINKEAFESMHSDCEELVKLLASITKSQKE